MTKLETGPAHELPRQVLADYAIVLLAAGALYVVTCAPGLLWQDSALFVYRVIHDDLVGKIGLATSHPAYVLLGMLLKRIPFGELAWKVNLISVVSGAVTIANVYLLVRLWLGRRFPAVIAAVTLCLSWTFWQHATIAEAYTFYAAVFSAELIVLLRYTQTSRIVWLYWLALLNGFSIANHMWGVLPLACYLSYVLVLISRRRVGLSQLAVMALLWTAGVSLYGWLIVEQIVKTHDVVGTLVSAVFADGWKGNVLNASLTLRMVVENIIFIVLNFPTPNIALLFVGAFLFRRLAWRDFGVVMIATMVLFAVFAFRYTVPDRHAFFLPMYIPSAVCIGIGAHFLVGGPHYRARQCIILALALLPPLVYCVTPSIARHAYPSLAERRQVPYRDDYKYWLQPWHTGYRGADRFGTEALGVVGANAVIYADTTTVHALLYAQEVLHLRPDVKIVSDFDHSPEAPVLNEKTMGSLFADLPIYVVSPLPTYCPQFILDKYDSVREGVLYRVVKRQGSQTKQPTLESRT